MERAGKIMKARKLFLAGAIAAAGLGISAPAFAQTDYVSPPGDDVLGTDLSRTTPAATAPDAAGGSLPVTGGDIVGLTVIGAAALGTGVVLVRRSRRTADSAQA
jgi:LPXTG-motif cell wall-anchored protein